MTNLADPRQRALAETLAGAGAPDELAGLALQIPPPGRRLNEDGTDIDDILPAAVGVLAHLITTAVAPRPEPQRPRRSWLRRPFFLGGGGWMTATLRDELLATGRREGGPLARHLVLAGPVDLQLASRWAGRVGAGSGARWQRIWRSAMAAGGLGNVDPMVAATRLAADYGRPGVRIVAGRTADDIEAALGDLTGVDLTGRLRVPVLGTSLLRRLNPILAVAVGPEEARRRVAALWPALAPAEPDVTLGAPDGFGDWAEQVGADLTRRILDGPFPVVGDPRAASPTASPDWRRVPSADTLSAAIEAIRRAWELEREEAPNG